MWAEMRGFACGGSPRRSLCLSALLGVLLLLVDPVRAGAEGGRPSIPEAIPEAFQESVSEAPPEEDPLIGQAKLAVRQKDFARAIDLWRQAAARGNAEAQYRLGIAYRSGMSVEKDVERAAEWLRRAAGGGHPDARFELGMMFRNGVGVARDRDEAIRLLELAARSGHRKAQSRLAEIRGASSVAYASADSRVVANRRDPRAALNQAIRTRDLGAAREAIARGAPLDGAPGDEQHWRPLILSIDREWPAMVALLLENRANANIRSRDGEPALVLAIRSGNREIVRNLLRAKARPNVRAVSGYSPLMVAAQHGHAGIVQDLVQSGAAVTHVLEDGTSAASVARRFGHTELYRNLVRRGAPAALASDGAERLAVLETRAAQGSGDEAASMPPLIEAARRGDLELLREMVDRELELSILDSEGENALTRAVMGGHAEAVRILLEAGFDPDLPGAEGKTALLRAMGSRAANGDAAFLILLESGASIHTRDERGRGVMDYAASGATAKKLEAFRSAGGSWTSMTIRNALADAAEAGHPRVVAALLGSIEFPADRISALCRAVEQKHVEVLSLLLEQGSAANGSCGSGRTPISIASRMGDLALVEQLIAAGAKPDDGESDHDTALIAAASRGHEAIVTRLLAQGAEVDRRGARRMTALMAAASNGHAKIVGRLLEAGADRRMRSDTDHTALDFARQSSSLETAERIESYRTGSWAGLFGGGDR